MTPDSQRRMNLKDDDFLRVMRDLAESHKQPGLSKDLTLSPHEVIRLLDIIESLERDLESERWQQLGEDL